ncbi:MAG: hypothetical protein KKE29_19995 [Proteobacteria bacterium]|nr:hypothetical protein [Pseudomonadota bacterium]MBV1715972.1 hypothetical protein [Desulfarculus sp.]
MSRRIPTPDPALVEALDRLYPDKCPDPKDSERQIWIKVGQRSVVRKLQQALEDGLSVFETN